MNKPLGTFLLAFVLAFNLCPQKAEAATNQYETYIECWPTFNTAVYTGISDYTNVIVDFAFSSFNVAPDGTPGGFQITEMQLTTMIAYIKSKNGKVKMSFGGATTPYWFSRSSFYPAQINTLASYIVNTITNLFYIGMPIKKEWISRIADHSSLTLLEHSTFLLTPPILIV